MRFEYAGESMTERISVVNEDGKLERVNCVPDDIGGGLGSADARETSEAALEFDGGRLCLGFPIPMFACECRVET